MITQKHLKEILNYDSSTGVFTWVNRRSKDVKAGDIAGSKSADGYIVIGINGKIYRSHRLAWVYFYGDNAPEQVDHINCIRDDNRIVNLREATNQLNSFNRSSTRNTPGVKGVSFHKRIGKWQANMRVNGRLIHLGYYDDILDAKKIINDYRLKKHGDFTNYGNLE